MTLARIRIQSGDCEQARQLLATIYDQFTEGFETRDLKAAAEMLRALDGTCEFDPLVDYESRGVDDSPSGVHGTSFSGSSP
jgi:hypothetical protein